MGEPRNEAKAELLKEMLELAEKLAGAFSQRRLFKRMERLMLSGLLTAGTRCISRLISMAGRDQADWSADYRVYSRSPWEVGAVFEPIMKECLAWTKGAYVGCALDDTSLPRTGVHVEAASWQRDPMSPKFHLNLRWGVRYLQFSATLPLYEHAEGLSSRGVPVGFYQIPVVKKPGAKGSEEEWAEYRAAKKAHNLSTQAVAHMKALRGQLDRVGGAEKMLVMAGDGSYCNKTVMRAELERTILVMRCRKDIRLCHPSKEAGRVYGAETFTPEDVRQDERQAYRTARVFHGGKRRELKYKELKGVLWRRGTQRKPVRLIVVAPTPYRLSKTGKTYYRQSAYLLVTDDKIPVEKLLQVYLDRWEIEVNHRDEKTVLGVGDAQVWSKRSVDRQPALAVAGYSLLLLAGLKTYGLHRGGVYEQLPKWRKRARRPSCLDLVTRLRREAMAHPELLEPLGIGLSAQQLVRKASA